MRYITLLLCLSFALLACKEKHPGERETTLASNFVSITDEENKGIASILSLYGGECRYSKGYVFSTNDKNKYYFEIEISKSEALNSIKDKLFITTSNIAFLFNQAIKKQEDRYPQINVVINQADGASYSAEYELRTLELVKSKTAFLNHIISIIAEGRYSNFVDKLNPTSAMADMDEVNILRRIHYADSIFGKINIRDPFTLMGFSEIQDKPEQIRIYGQFKRTIKNSAFRIDLLKEGEAEFIEEFDYKF